MAFCLGSSANYAIFLGRTWDRTDKAVCKRQTIGRCSGATSKAVVFHPNIRLIRSAIYLHFHVPSCRIWRSKSEVGVVAKISCSLTTLPTIAIEGALNLAISTRSTTVAKVAINSCCWGVVPPPYQRNRGIACQSSRN